MIINTGKAIPPRGAQEKKDEQTERPEEERLVVTPAKQGTGGE